jgi:putative heme iron utilization protein
MSKEKGDVLQPVDDTVRRLGKTLVRTAHYAALASIDPSDGAPSVSRVSLATAMDGAPVFLISRLSSHFTNLEADPRCSLLVGEPGKGDPLAYPRITLIGMAECLLAGPERVHVKNRFLRRHPKAALYVDFPDFAFWRFATARASLNGGFGKAYALSSGDLATPLNGLASLADFEDDAVAHMNDDHAEAVERYAAKAGVNSSGGWRLSTIDPEGLDLTCGDDVARLWFDVPLASPQDLRPVLVALAKAPS